MKDWADDIEQLIADAYAEHGAILAADADGMIATALRKAKADGMRLAEQIIQAKADSYVEVGSYIQADILADYATELGLRVIEIEKGQ